MSPAGWGIGTRPTHIGMVLDADEAVVALATACKVAEMGARGDVLPSDVVSTTHICPATPTKPHKPASMMDGGG